MLFRSNPTEDYLYVDFKVHLIAKRKGLRLSPDLDLATIPALMPAEVMKRMVWRVALGQYDLLGLTSVFLIQLKLIMRDLSGEEGRKLAWDEVIPTEIRDKFIDVLAKMDGVRKIKFPRCVVPSGVDESVKPDLLVFADGSTSAFCTVQYARWKLLDGTYQFRLIAGKARVAPLKKLTVPRIELLGAVAGVRLAQQIQEHLGIEFGRRWFFTDSSAVLGMLRGKST